MDISIFGLGYVGTVCAACLASHGHKIIGVDIDLNKVNMLNNGKPSIIEPEVNELIEKAVARSNLRATINAKEAVLMSELTFICVGTPSQENNQINLKHVKETCQNIGEALKEKNSFHTIVCRSTLFPGSMKNIVIPILEQFSGKTNGIEFDVCINPEFMKEGSAVYDFFNPPKNVIGANDKRPHKVMSDLIKTYNDLPTIFLDIESAEFIKYCDNIWHALKVGYANEIGNICKKLGIDSHRIMDVFCTDTKLNLSPYYLKPGFAFGGSCLPKDLRALLYESKKLNLELPIIDAVLPSNQLQIDNALKLIMEQGKKKIGVLGFSFKADTNDLRESPVVELIERLLGKGYSLFLYDKNVEKAKYFSEHYLSKQMSHIAKLMVPTINDVLENSEVIIIGNHSNEFASVVDSLSHHQTVIDLVRIKKHCDSNQYIGICW